MQDFKNILFVSRGLVSEELALRQALRTCNANSAHLKIIVFTPELPNNLNEYKQVYKDALLAKVMNTVNNLAKDESISTNITNKFDIAIENNEQLIVNIVKKVIAEKIDLVIKAADEVKSKIGLNAVDMSLVRKCPCPVWICKNDLNIKQPNIAVTLEPNDTDPVRLALSQKLLKLADNIAQQQGAKLTIISTWDCPFEEAMRDSKFYGIPQEILDNTYKQEESRAMASVENILQMTKLQTKYELIVKKGITFLIIPEILTANNIDLLVIGTLARIGVPGFIIGNTAENIFQKASCSVLALKPDGYVSPIK